MTSAIPFLAIWSVGIGRLEALVTAASADEITSRYPELNVVPLDAALDHVPPQHLAALQAQPPLSIEGPPAGILAEVLAFRLRREDLNWCSNFAASLLLLE